MLKGRRTMAEIEEIGTPVIMGGNNAAAMADEYLSNGSRTVDTAPGSREI